MNLAILLIFLYLLLGLLFGVWFVFFKLPSIDSQVKESKLGFSIMILPTSVLLWPLIALNLIIIK